MQLCGYRFDELLQTSSTFPGYFRYTQGVDDTAPDLDTVSRATNTLAWRRLISTASGRIGLAPASAQQHDRIAVLKGRGVPLVLRPFIGKLLASALCMDL